MLDMVLRTVMLGDGSEPGTRGWVIARRDELRSVLRSARLDQDIARGIYEQLRQHGGWDQLRSVRGTPFRSFDHFCADSNGLRIKRLALEERLGVPPLAPQGRPTKDQGKGSNTTFIGRGADYLIARLKRDAPNYLERLTAGEFRSARAAALAAGIIKPTPVLVELNRIWKRASPDDRATFLADVAATPAGDTPTGAPQCSGKTSDVSGSG